MALNRLFAYATDPQRTMAKASAPPGGALAPSAQLEAALRAASDPIGDGDWIDVSFRAPSDPPTDARRNEVRQRVRDVAHGSESEAADGAAWLALRLSTAMDHRARAHLLTIFTETRSSDSERVMMWAFPQDDAFRFSTRERPRIDLLQNVFSRTSSVRKAAEFEGTTGRSDFLTGRVVDLQAGRTATSIADYWISGFLDCQLEMTPIVGTQLMADTFRRAFDIADTPEQRRQLQVAAMQIQQAPRTSWTLTEVANELLPAPLAVSFLASSPVPHMNDARHEVDQATFERALATRVFQLDSGVLVTAPIDEVGRSVIVDGDRLTLEGVIVGERLGRGRRGH